MQEVFLRFPHLSENIFQSLNSESLAKSREVCIFWYDYLDGQKFLHARANKVKSIIETVAKLGHVQKCHPQKNTLNTETSKQIIDDARNWNFDLVHEKIMKSINFMYDGLPFYRGACFYYRLPFFIAAHEGHFAVVKYLVDNLEDKNPKSYLHSGSTPLHIAASFAEGHINLTSNDRIDVLKYIMSKVLDVNPKNNFGNTPLHYAVRGGKLDVVKYIMDQIKDKNPKNNEGNTPLHLAVNLQWHGRLSVFKYIIENVAEKNPSNNDGKTPLDLACAKRDWEIVKIATKYWPFAN